MSNPRRKLRFEQMEARQMMAADLLLEVPELTIHPLVVPAYSSNPAAPATLYLDFNGHFQDEWGDYSDAYTPPFDVDNHVYSFGTSERQIIQEVWQRVAEDFAPFNINVTTVNPDDFSNGNALRVAIGGSYQDWYGSPAGGVAYRNSFTNGIPNVVYVFADDVGGTAKNIADAASHEAGHAFGARHQSLVNDQGQVVEEYIPGTAAKGPIMGNHYGSQRTTWWYGTASADSGNSYVMQDDMAVIASSTNGFGYRPDDFGNTYQSATSLGILSNGTVLSRSGIIATTSDSDWFKVQVANPGTLSLQANVIDVGANLDARLTLFRMDPVRVQIGPISATFYKQDTIAMSDPASSLNASVSAYLAAGTYYVRVDSHGEYGDVGQYVLKGTAPASTSGTKPAIVSVTSANSAQSTKTSQPTISSSYHGSLNTQILAGPLRQATGPLAALLAPMTVTSQKVDAIDEVMASHTTVVAKASLSKLIDSLAIDHATGRSRLLQDVANELAS